MTIVMPKSIRSQAVTDHSTSPLLHLAFVSRVAYDNFTSRDVQIVTHIPASSLCKNYNRLIAMHTTTAPQDQILLCSY